MQKTRTERMVSFLLSFGKLHRWAKHIMLACIFVVLGLSYFGRKVSANTKKLTLAGFVVCFFFICSSFAFTNVTENDLVDVSEYMEDAVISLQPTGHIMLYGDDVQKIVLEDHSLTNENVEDVALNDTSYDNFSYDDYDDEEFEMDENEDGEKYTIDDILEQMDSVSFDSEAVSYAESGTTFGKDDWNLLLVNKQHPIPDGVEPELVNIVGDKKCDERVVGELLQMMQAAKEDGVNLMICSAHRSYDYQVMLFQRKITRYMNRGYSYIDAYQLSSQAVTLPGYSEHQLGLAFDIVTPSYVSLNEGFAKTLAGMWLKDNAYKYGFILRYPEGKEFVTGIEFEPWHYRYVGVEAATIIMENEITLEEFIENLEDYVCTPY